MNNLLKDVLNSSIKLKKELSNDFYFNKFFEIGNLMRRSIENKNKLIFCGNGGSAADAQHLAAELIVRLRSDVNRQTIPALALTLDSSTLTACANDIGFDHLFERNLEAVANEGDVLICISTSGLSKNILLAAQRAKSMGVITVALTGKTGGLLKKECDYVLQVPSTNTARIQECHITIGHALMEHIEDQLLNTCFITKLKN